MSNDTTETPTPTRYNCWGGKAANGPYILFSDYERDLLATTSQIESVQAELVKVKEEREELRLIAEHVTAELDGHKADLARVTKEREDAIKTCNFYTERSVGAMAIAEGDEGHEAIPRDCSMLIAVSELRFNRDQLASSLQRQAEYSIQAKTDLSTAQSKLHAIASLVEGYVDGAPDRNASATLANSVMHIISSTTKPAVLLGAEAKPHNPDNLTSEQVGVADGWRLLDEDEGKEEEKIPQSQYWDDGEWTPEDNDWWWFGAKCTLRTKLTRAELRKARGLDAISSSPSGSELLKDRGIVDWIESIGGIHCYRDSVSRTWVIYHQTETGYPTFRAAAITAGRKET